MSWITRSPKAARALLVCAGLVGGTCVSEITLRLYRVAHSRRGPSGEIPQPLPPDYRPCTTEHFDRKLLFIGDSFTYGFGVGDTQTYPRATEGALRRAGLRVRSLNAGRIGSGAAQELLLLRKLIDAEPVDGVVLQVLPYNDLLDNLEDGSFTVQDGKLVQLKLAPVLKSSLLVKGTQRLVGDETRPSPAYQDPATYELEHALLQEIAATVRRHNVPLVVLLAAQPWESDVRASWRGPMGAQASEERYRRVRTMVEELNVPWLDTSTGVTLEGDYITENGHWSPNGNLHVGEALARKWIPLLGPAPGSSDSSPAPRCDSTHASSIFNG